MKQRFLLLASLILATMFGFNAKAQVPSASTQLYDFSQLNEQKFVKLFYDAIQDGRTYPTDAEFEAAFGYDIEFLRSHIPIRSIAADAGKQLLPETTINKDRRLWMNTPAGSVKVVGGFPSGIFQDDVFSMWQYTHLFGAWNHGLFQAPGSWGDAAHKHGTKLYAGIKFFESWTPGSGDKTYTEFVTTLDTDGNYIYAEAFINALMYLGLDGINYNWEDMSYFNTSIQGFHKALYRIAKEKEFDNFSIGMYTQNSSLSDYYQPFLYYGEDNEKVIDCFLNYSGGDFATSDVENSISIAKNTVGHTRNLYQGVWIVTMDRSWTEMADAKRRAMNIVLWGEHDASRFYSYNSGNGAFGFQENYQKLLERGFSGGNRNPANRPTLSNSGNNWEKEGSKEALQTFGGLASLIPERSTVYGKLPFCTHFQLGNGERYNYKGKKTMGSWYSMGSQDMQPTYRWLVYGAGTTTTSTQVMPKYSHVDAYNGGSMLVLEGNATSAGTDIVLYRSNLEITSPNPKVSVAVKSLKEGNIPSNLYVILKKEGGTGWEEFKLGDIAGQQWVEKEIRLKSFKQNDKITSIGLRVKADTPGDKYMLYVGKLEIKDDRTVSEIASINNLIAEVKRETKKSLAVKVRWGITGNPTTRATESGLIYNEEANIDHFELMYKNGDKGDPVEVGRTTSWSHYLGDFQFKDEGGVAEEPYVGVRAVSIDGKTHSPIKWIKIPRGNATQLPDNPESEYCSSTINPRSADIQNAYDQRYLVDVHTTNAETDLVYTAASNNPDHTQYVDATAYKVKAKQGTTFQFYFKAFNGDPSEPDKAGHPGVKESAGDGLIFCFAEAYVDWDGNGIFNAETERMFKLGRARAATDEFQTTGVTVDFEVPEQAVPGTSRMRVVFSDAWSGHPGPCGLTYKGATIDFTVEITGDNTGIVEEDLHDQGAAEQPVENIGTELATHHTTPELGNTGGEKEINTTGSLDFGKVQINSIAKNTITIENPGDLDVEVTDIIVPTGYSVDWKNGTILANTSKTFNLTFNPTEIKDYSGKLEIVSNADKGVTKLDVTGEGEPLRRELKVVGGDLDFKGIKIGKHTTRTFIIKSVGNDGVTINSIDYSDATFKGQLVGNAVILPGEEKTVTVTFTPTAEQTYNSLITVKSNATVVANNTLNATGKGQLEEKKLIKLTGDLTFGNVKLNTTATKTFTIENEGNVELNVSAIDYSSAAGFSGNWSGSILPGLSQDVTVKFKPTEAKDYTGKITVKSDATNAENKINVSGKGTEKLITLSGELKFGEVEINKEAKKTFTITNTGNVDVTISNVEYPEGYFGNFFSGTIAVGQSKNVEVTFKPTETKDYDGIITVNSDASGNNTIDVTGTYKKVKEISLSLASLNFGEVKVNKDSILSFTISNKGNADISISKLESKNKAFTFDWKGGSIAVGKSKVVKVTFKPTAAGSYTSILTITSDATGNNRIVAKGIGKDKGTAVENISEGSLASRFYPNPVEDYLFFENTQKIWVFTAKGDLIIHKKLNSQKLDVSSLPEGVYIVKMMNNNVIRTGKFVKK